MNNTTTATIHWKPEGTPVATHYDDVYFSVDNGLAESRYVFIEQNQLLQRWSQHLSSHYVIAETGFGTGLNFLATWQHYQQHCQQQPNTPVKRLHFISFEKHPLSLGDLKQALQAWSELLPFSEQLLEYYPQIMTAGCHRLLFESPIPICLDLWIGDVHDNLPELVTPSQGLVDSWYLDGFAPSKNPDMWSPQLFEQMARLSKPQASVATFTAAGFVRRGLNEVGFAMQKGKGFGRKRDMLVGHYQGEPQAKDLLTRLYQRQAMRSGEDLAIIGAGIAGVSLAYAMVKRGVKVSLYEKNKAAALEASGNRQGAVYPLLSPTQQPLTEFFQHAFNYHHQLMLQLKHQQREVEHQFCGLLQLAYNEKSQKKHRKVTEAGYPSELVHAVNAEQASELAGLSLSSEALHYPKAGWVDAQQCVQTILDAALATGLLEVHYQHELIDYQQHESYCRLIFTGHEKHHHNVAFCQAHHLLNLTQAAQLPLSPVRGQVSHIKSNPSLAKLRKVLCYEGYLTPAYQQQHCIGASYLRNQVDLELRTQETESNLAALRHCQPQAWNQHLECAEVAGRVAIRCAVRDHLPLLGQLPDLNRLLGDDYQNNWQTADSPVHSRSFLAVGFGSRGICSAPFATELLAAQLCGEPLPLKASTLRSVHPQRFWNRRLLKGRPMS
ncbi:bifunctional tRNA (5-methylaminomethyl-2-thiouridine)(34)-methyltransferase MnmD/FAD-dependent 5-carboxymethylaminomethyl-2-thiouridine(34) oxidoreductase MnmC [Agarivorans gilvus]|uniref:bifunctional tRNA (5-methylaminomethyl-2-thiouridine)(34)-methyltransferase MnmD/FAD-dependent 5-carboxymethylaminomethyl-2-thiouridine(34) oxidoreductase MnmC n=1 Tax=Agarivorans gilvus TaxID=680279 RepID=UPI001663377F|nr:bifunctional tRNA (5-methylaminomethyl-2-thiouridine)(34)-methyltransferase MnmD/FAD-dependent 5-carboxymethylaminomethyl-2-thiouridine(34) oxidoreductase MnmC [Agarivorans gilvus]